MKRIIALYDTDLQYCNRFIEVIHQRQDLNFQIISFTNEKSLSEFLTTGYIEILLLGEREFDYEKWKDAIKTILYLTEEDNDFNSYPPKICKYQHMESLWISITSVYQKENAGMDTPRHGPQKIITFLSFYPMENHEQYCFSYGNQRSKEHKLLYISMDLLPTKSTSYSIQGENFLSDLIYYIKENPHKIPQWNTYIQYYGTLSYLTGISHGLDLISLNQEDAKSWISLLQKTEYAEIIFYFNTYTEFTLEIMASSHELYMIIDQDMEHNGKLEEFMRQVNFMNLDLQMDKICFIQKDSLSDKCYG